MAHLEPAVEIMHLLHMFNEKRPKSPAISFRTGSYTGHGPDSTSAILNNKEKHL